jgi:hypothetical protein
MGKLKLSLQLGITLVIITFISEDSLFFTFNINSNLEAVPWLKRLVAGLSPRMPGFAPGSIHVGSVVDKVALGRFSPSTSVSPANI